MAGEDTQLGSGTDVEASLATKLNYLFDTIHPRSRGPYSNQEAARSIQENQGLSLSGTYLWMLRNGRRDNPSMQVVAGIAAFFGVPVGYFFDEEVTRRVDAQLELLSTMADAGVRTLATRAADLSPRGLVAIRDMIEHWRSAEGVSGGEHEPPSSA